MRATLDDPVAEIITIEDKHTFWRVLNVRDDCRDKTAYSVDLIDKPLAKS